MRGIEKMLERVVETIAKYPYVEAEQLNRDSHLFNDLSLNSFELVELICELEESLNVEIPEEHIAKFRTIGDVVDYLEKSA
jgi:acyl carrier protein